VMPSIYSTDTPLSDVSQSLYIRPVQCFAILSYVSRRRTTPAVYYRSSRFCAVPSASRVSALISSPAVSPAQGCHPAGFGPGGLGTYHLKGHSFFTCTNPRIICCTTCARTLHIMGSGEFKFSFFFFNLYCRRFSSPRCGDRLGA
jgi:hypothetical protein